MPQLGLGSSLRKPGGVGRIYVKDGLKLYMPYRGSDASEVDFVGTGSTSFDGSNDYVSVADAANLSFGDGSTDSAFSISAWINMDDATSFKIATKGIYNSTGEWHFKTDTDDKLYLVLFDESVADSYEIAYTTAVLTAYEGSWVHVCGTYNGVGGTSANGGISLYVNGVGVAMTLTGGGTYVAMENLAADVHIGRLGSTYAEGSIKNVAIWSRALTATEVQNVMYKSYNEVSGRLASGLVSWWSLDAKDSLGSELITDADNRTLDSVTGFWTEDSNVDIEDGVVRFKSASGNQGIANNGGIISSDTDKIMQLSFDLVEHTSGSNVQFYIGGSIPLVDISSGTLGTYKVTGIVSNSNNYIQVRANESSSTFAIDNLSVKQVSIEDLHGSNDGTISGATVDDDLYGGDTPVKPRGIDNAPTVQADAIGAGSASFNGSSDYINTGTGIDLGSTTDFTITCWAKSDDWTSQMLMGKIVDSSNRWYFTINGSDYLYFFSLSGGASGIDYTGTTALTNGEWTHIAFVADRDANTKGYINGILDDTDTGTDLDLDLDTSSDFTIGKLGSDYFTGNICQVGIWKGVLTQAEIQSVMEKTFEELTADDKSSLGAELVTSITNSTSGSNGYTTFTGSSGNTVSSLADVDGTGQAYANEVGAATTKLYKVVCTLTINSGAPTLNANAHEGSYTSGDFKTGTTHSALVTGTNTYYVTFSSTARDFLWFNAGVCDISDLTISCKEVTHDLVSYWALDEAEKALDFVRANTDYIDLGNPTALQITDPAITVSAWCLLDTDLDFCHIAMNSNGGNYEDGHNLFYYDQKLWFSINHWSTNVAYVAFTDYGGGWHHVVGTYDGTNIKIYLDGSAGTSDTYTADIGNLRNTFIGAGFGTSPGETWDGKIAKVAIYNTALSAAQVLTQYNLGINGDYSSDSNLAGYWKLDNATTVTDLSGNGNNGTVNGADLVDGYVLDKTSSNNDGTLI